MVNYREIAIDIINNLSEEQIIDFLRQFLDENTIARIETENIINDSNRPRYSSFDDIVKEIENEQ